ncbi:MAG: glycoside hydrolase family 30 protein [Bacteroidota bacterium]
MKSTMLILLTLLMLVACDTESDTVPAPSTGPNHEFWLTTADKSALFTKQTQSITISSAGVPVIDVDVSQTYQSMEGFGFALTGGSAQVLYAMSAPARAAVLKELFATDGANIGISYLRISIGASDLDDRVFSYNDLPAGQTDTAMAQFSIAPDKTHLIPVLKEILAINPAITILGSPWSAPVWMKTNGSSIGGSLRVPYYSAYAKYFVKYIQAMQQEGITIHAITVQNEPLHGGNNPSMLMQASEQAFFIKRYLAPAFKENNITTRIIVYDHNADRTDYPLAIYADSAARAAVDGAAFHLYGGSIDNLTAVHNAYPDKHLYFTEQWIGAPGNFPEDLKWHTNNLTIGAARNWCRVVLEWNLAADPNQNPHTPGGCTECLGAITVDGDNIIRNPAYYIVAHASKFVRPGSVRIQSAQTEWLNTVAYLRNDGKRVLIAINNGSTAQAFFIREGTTEIATVLAAGAVGTYVW